MYGLVNRSASEECPDSTPDAQQAPSLCDSCNVATFEAVLSCTVSIKSV